MIVDFVFSVRDSAHVDEPWIAVEYQEWCSEVFGEVDLVKLAESFARSMRVYGLEVHPEVGIRVEPIEG